MNIKLYGVMGSIAGGSSDLGKNTTCLVISNNKRDLILDLGTGILNYMEKNTKPEYHLLLSHYHMDHILGFPFIPQLFSNEYKLNLYGPNFNNKSVEEELIGFMREPYLPIKKEHISANLNSTSLVESETLMINGYEVEALNVDHPGGSYIYSIKMESKKITFLSDFPNGMELNEKVINFCSKSDLIYADAMFVEEEFSNKKLIKYGHSSIESVIRFFEKSGSKKLVLGHHSISRQYSDLKHYEEDNIIIAKENMEIQI